MNVKEIVEYYLRAFKFDGLFNDDVPCDCLAGDLAPGEDDFSDCKPGYRRKCDCGEEHEFHVTAVNSEDE